MDLFGRKTVRQLEARVSALGEQLAAEKARPPRVINRMVIAPRRLAGQRFDMSAGADGPLTWSWTRTPMSVDEVTERNLRPVRARSRQQSRSNEYMMRLLSMVQAGIIGPPGMLLQARVLDRPGVFDTRANAALEDAWQRWGEPENCDCAGRLSWFEHQLLFARTVAMDGEYLARLVLGRGAGPFGIQLQPLDVELLDVEHNRKLPSGNTIKFGIEYNANWKPVAYWLQDEVTRTRKYSRYPASEIIHCYVTLEAQQKRGWPWAFTALMSMNMLGGYEEAAVAAARLGASRPLVITTPEEEGAQPDDIETSEAEGDQEGVEYIDADDPLSLWRLNPGEQVASFDPSYPTGEFDPFVRAVLRRICAGCNVSYDGMTGDLSQASYSSTRSGKIDERDAWMMLQTWAQKQFMRPIYRAWLPQALLHDQIVFPDGPASWSPEREQKFSRVVWQGRRWPWLDPESDVASNTTAIEQALTTRSRVMREQGLDPEEVWLERQREDEQLKQLGIAVPVVGQIPGGSRKNGGSNA